MFGDAIRYDRVWVRRRKWFPFQPRQIVMAPNGHIHFHPHGTLYCDDFTHQPLSAQGLFIHEMTHVWQVQTRGKWWLLARRHPLCRYDYSLKPGWRLERYNPEQQAEIIRHAFLLRNGVAIPGVADARAYDLLVDFPSARTTRAG